MSDGHTRVRASREVSVAGHCMQAGDDALKSAESHGDGFETWRTASIMCAITMWVFALEAAVNHLIHRLYEQSPELQANVDFTPDDAYWLDLRTRIELFYSWVGELSPDFGTPPHQVVGTLRDFRNSIAHGKPHVAEPIDVVLENGELVALPPQLMARWEKECTLEQAQRHRADVIALHAQLAHDAGIQLGDPISMLAVLSIGY